jgi:dihydrofolate reductase
MRKLVYSVAMSLDGFIAGQGGEYDWIIEEPSLDLEEQYRGFDTLLMGRRTYELMLEVGQTPKSMGMNAVVVSTTLDPALHHEVRIVSNGVADAVAKLKTEAGKDIWLFGGGMLFRAMMDAGLVDVVEFAVQPILLGSGVPVIPDGRRWPLRLEACDRYPNGTLMLRYSVPASSAT